MTEVPKIQSSRLPWSYCRLCTQPILKRRRRENKSRITEDDDDSASPSILLEPSNGRLWMVSDVHSQRVFLCRAIMGRGGWYYKSSFETKPLDSSDILCYHKSIEVVDANNEKPISSNVLWQLLSPYAEQQWAIHPVNNRPQICSEEDEYNFHHSHVALIRKIKNAEESQFGFLACLSATQILPLVSLSLDVRLAKKQPAMDPLLQSCIKRQLAGLSIVYSNKHFWTTTISVPLSESTTSNDEAKFRVVSVVAQPTSIQASKNSTDC